MFTSSAGVFRIRQSVADLRSYLRQSGRPVRERLARSFRDGIAPPAAEERLSRVIDLQGGRFQMPGDASVHEVCRLAAALPSDDYPLFTFSTALLLLDRLQSQQSDDDLYWNWESFREEYALADPPVRAALMNGFRVGAETGRVQIDIPPGVEDCQTLSQAEVLSRLRTSDADDLRTYLLSNPTAEVAGRAWARIASEPPTALQIMTFRYLYERPESISPDRASDAPLIPWSPA